jgi:hypothetical protein
VRFLSFFPPFYGSLTCFPLLFASNPLSFSLLTYILTPPTSPPFATVHVFESTPLSGGRSASYKLTSTVMLYLTKPIKPAAVGEGNQSEGEVQLGGSMTRQVRCFPPSFFSLRWY